MSKKKFTDGLESLFSLSIEENEKEEVLLVVEAEEKQEKTQTEKKKTKRKASKSFAADLDFLFSGTSAYVEEEKKEEEKPSTTKKEKTGKKSDGPKVFSGLEALLRNTIDTSRYNQVEPSKMKRVTFTFDKEKLVRLKKIAKEQKAYLKDIIGKVVSEYIEEYENDPDKAVTE